MGVSFRGARAAPGGEADLNAACFACLGEIRRQPSRCEASASSSRFPKPKRKTVRHVTLGEMMRRLALIGAAALAFAAARPAEAACGKFRAAIKDVKVSKPQGQPTPAQAGSEVCSGDKVVAGVDSRASIEMEDKNVLNISPNTSIVIEAYEKKKVVLNVLGGKLRSSIAAGNKYDEKNAFQVKTKSAVAGVRGTDFLTGYSPSTGKTEVVTFSGRVDVGQPGTNGTIANPVSVGPGQKTEAAAGQPPAPPRPVPASELKQLNQSTSSSPTSAGPASSAGAGSATGKDGSKDGAAKDGDAPAKSDGNAAANNATGAQEGASSQADKPGEGGGKNESGGSGPGSGSKSASGPAPAGTSASPGGKGAATGDGSAPRSPATNAGPLAGTAPTSAAPAGGASMVNAGDASGGAMMMTPSFASAAPAPAAPVIFTPPTTLPPPLPTFTVDPNIANVIQNSGPTKVRINIKY